MQPNQTRQAKLHITQHDNSNSWMLSVENADGTLALLSFDAPSPDHLVDDAEHLAKRRFPGALILRDPARPLGALPPVPTPVPGMPTPKKVSANAAEVVAEAETPAAASPTGKQSPQVTQESQWVYWTSDGAGQGMTVTPLLYQWILAQGQVGAAPNLIIYGGDVYNDGQSQSYQGDGSNSFLNQIGGTDTLALMCETPGNHDWLTCNNPGTITAYPAGYEGFWGQYPPPDKSRQPIDTSKTGGARYEHYIDMMGWRFVFLDTGALDAERNVWDSNPWPMGDVSRLNWLEEALAGQTQTGPARQSKQSNLVFAHHSRLSNGQVGDNMGVDVIWRNLFAPDGSPLAAFTMAGHDHNVSVYQSRDINLQTVSDFNEGVQVIVNGAGGYVLMNYTNTDVKTPVLLQNGQSFTLPDLYPDFGNTTNDYCKGAPIPTYCVCQLELISPLQARLKIWSFGCSLAAAQINQNDPCCIYDQTYNLSNNL